MIQLETAIAHPKVVSREEWLVERKKLLAAEKELTKLGDKVDADRRRLPMVKIEKDYVFDSPDGKRNLAELFEGRLQLIIYHFMFDPEWEKGCPGCTGMINALGDLSMLNERNTTYAVISRAPLAKLLVYKADQGWDIDWYSSYGSDFNYDFHVTFDSSIAPIEHNFKNEAELNGGTAEPHVWKGESHGVSVFFRVGDDVYHTYSAYARGVESLTDSYSLLDVTPYGRQEDWEDSPAGWPQKPTYE